MRQEVPSRIEYGFESWPFSLGDLRHVIFPICKTELAFLALRNELVKYLERHCQIQEPLATWDY